MAQDEVLFREVNERVQEKADDFGGGDIFQYLRECANADCTFRLTLTREQYESIRSDPAQFVVLPLHFTPDVDVLMGEHDGFWIVRKTGEAGEYVEKLDPRSR